MNLNEITAWVALALTVSAGLINCAKIIKKEVEPTLSTWIIFLCGTSLSFASYLISSNHDFKAGALNGADLISQFLIILTILFFGATKWKLKSFEKYYFSGLLIIALFWIFTDNAFRSNLLIQFLLTLGYIPTFHTIIKFKRNTESFTVWSLVLMASVISLIPSLAALQSTGNILGLIYSGRSVVLGVILISLMFTFKEAA